VFIRDNVQGSDKADKTTLSGVLPGTLLQRVNYERVSYRCKRWLKGWRGGCLAHGRAAGCVLERTTIS